MVSYLRPKGGTIIFATLNIFVKDRRRKEEEDEEERSEKTQEKI
jgi:hypothetical protein